MLGEDLYYQLRSKAEGLQSLCFRVGVYLRSGLFVHVFDEVFDILFLICGEDECCIFGVYDDEF